jgi:hypothetical protein
MTKTIKVEQKLSLKSVKFNKALKEKRDKL